MLRPDGQRAANGTGRLQLLDDRGGGRCGPHRLQHLLSRAVWDDQRVLDIASAWAVSHLDDGDAVLIVDETADEKSSADAAGAARQYSGTVGGIALCQVAVTLTYATGRGHALIGRALYLPEGCAADEEHRELAGVPAEVLFATKPQLAGALLDRAHCLGIRAAFVAGDEVYGGRELRRDICQRGMGYVMAVRSNHALTTGSGRAVTAARAVSRIPGHAWHRMRTGSGTKGTRHYGWAMLELTSHDTPDEHDGGHSVLLARRHRYTGTGPPLEVLAPLDRDLPAHLHLPRRRRRPATPGRRRLRPGRRADPGNRPGTAAAPARHRHPTTPARPGPPAALVSLATPPPAPRSPSPSTLEHLRRDNTMITTNYSCRIRWPRAG